MDERVEYTNMYNYLGVVFSGTTFSARQATKTRLTRPYATLEALERMCSQVQFQEPHTKLWLFDTLVASTMHYEV